MGRHASTERQRRVATWPIIVAVVLAVLAAVILIYVHVVGSSGRTAACSGRTVLAVTASPGAAPAVTDAATAFNATTPVARSTCVSVSVSMLSGPATAAALLTGWQHQLTAPPALWVADSAADVARVDGADSAMTAGRTDTGLASSPVVLAARSAPAGGSVSWASLADAPAGTAVALPDPAVNRATWYAVESMLAARSGTTGPITVSQAAGATTLISALRAAVPAEPGSTATALAGLAAGRGGVTMVPVVEAELAAFNAVHGADLVAVRPAGPTAGDQILAVPLTASWVTSAMADAAAAFDAFLGGDGGKAAFGAHHLLVGAATATTTPTTAKAAGASSSASLPASASSVALRGPGETAEISLAEAPVGVRDVIEQAWTATEPASVSTGPAVTAASSPPTPGAAGLTTGSGLPGGGTAHTAGGTPGLLASTPSVASAPRFPASQAQAATTPASRIATTSAPTSPRPTSTARTTGATTTSQPAFGPAVTIVIDTSGSMSTLVAGRSRIGWTQSAVAALVGSNVNDQFGLWSFGTGEGSPGYRQEVALGPLSGPIGALSRAQAISQALAALVPGGNSYTYATIAAAVADAANATPATVSSRVIVITDGSDSTPHLSRGSLLATVAALHSRNPRLILDIVGLSDEVNVQAMQQIAAAGQGSYLAITDLAELEPTLQTLTNG